MKVLLYTVWNAHWYSTFPRERQKRNHDYDSQVSTLLFIYLIRYSTGDALRAAISNFYSSLIFEGTDKSWLPFPTSFSIKSCEDAQSSTFLICSNIFLDSLSPNVSHDIFFSFILLPSSKHQLCDSTLGNFLAFPLYVPLLQTTALSSASPVFATCNLPWPFSTYLIITSQSNCLQIRFMFSLWVIIQL